MKETMTITTLEQLELLVDPACLAIINFVFETPVTKKQIAEELEEELDFISDAVDRLVSHGLFERVALEDSDVPGYRRTACRFDALGMMGSAKVPDPSVLSAFINYIENNILDYYRLLAGAEDSRKALADMGYAPPWFSELQYLLTEEEARDCRRHFLEYMKKYDGRRDGDAAGCRPYEIGLIIYPYIPEFRRRLRAMPGSRKAGAEGTKKD